MPINNIIMNSLQTHVKRYQHFLLNEVNYQLRKLQIKKRMHASLGFCQVKTRAHIA